MTSAFRNNSDEIGWNLINAALAGLLVFLGAFASGNISLQACATAAVAALIVAVTKFRDYWSTQQSEFRFNLFNFI